MAQYIYKSMLKQMTNIMIDFNKQFCDYIPRICVEKKIFIFLTCLKISLPEQPNNL